MSDDDFEIGFGWTDIESAGRTAFPYIHTAGKTLASAFGAGAAADVLEQQERRAGMLPPTTPPSAAPGVPPGAMPMATPARTPPSAASVAQVMQQVVQAQTPKKSPAASSPSKSSFWAMHKRSIEIAAAGAVAVGVLGLIIHFVRGKK